MQKIRSIAALAMMIIIAPICIILAFAFCTSLVVFLCVAVNFVVANITFKTCAKEIWKWNKS